MNFKEWLLNESDWKRLQWSRWAERLRTKIIEFERGFWDDNDIVRLWQKVASSPHADPDIIQMLLKVAQYHGIQHLLQTT